LGDDQQLQLLSFAAANVNFFFRTLNNSGCFLEETVQNEVAISGQRFLEAYCALDSLGKQDGYASFKIRPKMHMYSEVVVDLFKSPYNILGASCWADEDYIGRCSRTARSCSTGSTGLAMSVRAIQKILGQYRLQFQRFA